MNTEWVLTEVESGEPCPHGKGWAYGNADAPPCEECAANVRAWFAADAESGDESEG